MSMNTADFTAARDTFAKHIRGTVKTLVSAMAFARSMMQGKDEAEAAAEALNLLIGEYDALPKEKRAQSGLRAAIRAVYKDMSTAVAHERRNLKKEVNDPATEIEKLHAAFPFRIVCQKSVFCAVTHAQFDALRPSASDKTKDGEGDSEGADGSADGAKNPDKAALAIAALQLALDEMTADRNAWRDRAVLAESILDDVRKTPSAKPVAAKRTASAKPAKRTPAKKAA